MHEEAGSLPHLAPDVGTLFSFDNRRYVLQGWLKPDGQGRLTFCRRDEATHVFGRGMRGCGAPIAAVQVIGRAPWTVQQVNASRAYANELARAHLRCVLEPAHVS